MHNLAYWVVLFVLLVSSFATAQVKVNSLKVRIVTHRERGAGTDNAVYFDIGPLAWKLNKRFHNDFESGSDDTYELTVPDDFTEDDILWLRLHKKGFAHFIGTRDGLTGAWHPKTVTLIINGTESKPVVVDDPLNSSCWYWRSPRSDRSGLDLFARSLRAIPNEKLRLFSKLSGFVTTVFKKNGISPWLPNPAVKECNHSGQSTVPALVCATGEVLRKAHSTDGFETIDMNVAKVEACSGDIDNCPEVVWVDPVHGFKLRRYIRVENRHAHNRVNVGKVTRICGTLRWDTDNEGWWEIHPRNANDLPPKP
jgi:PLAT/LH2 domain-containing protein